MNELISAVGQSVGRRDAYAKVCGQTVYAGDIRRPGIVYGKIVRSPYAAALIQSIDTSAASRIQGVLAVLAAADVPGRKTVGARGVCDQPVFAESQINMAGEAVACVIAATEEIAQRAAEQVHVRYEPQEPISDPVTALLPSSRHLRPNGNLCHEFKIVHGDFQAALSRAAVVVNNTYRTQFVDHGYIEPDAIVAEPEGTGVVLYVTSKSPHNDQGQVANVLGLARDEVRVVVAAVGGSFGGKPDLPMLSIAALAAFKLQRPIKITLDRDECLTVKTKRHPYSMEYTHAVTDDGEILGVRVDIIADAGAYTSYSPTATSKGLIHAAGPYRIPNVDMRVRAVFTNNPVTGAMRGYGVPQVVFAVERQMDIIAKNLQIDPIELRLRNALRSGDHTVTGQRLGDAHLVEALLEAGRMSANVSRRATSAGKARARGVAAFYYGVGRTAVEDKARVRIRLDTDGLVQLFAGTPDTGQGSDTVLAQIAAQELALSYEFVSVISGDTRLTMDSGTSTASRVTYVVGNAVQRAACELKHLLLDVASEMEGRRVTHLESQQSYLSGLAQFCAATGIDPEREGYFQTACTGLDESGQGEPYGAYTFGVQLTELAVEQATGLVEVERAICCYDAGAVVNPMLLQAQIEGGTIMAQGYALTEELVVKGSIPQFPNLHTYLLPTAVDASKVLASAVPSFEKSGPFGAKGVGEPTTLPGAASIANALSSALGCEFYDLPITTENVVRAMGELS